MIWLLFDIKTFGCCYYEARLEPYQFNILNLHVHTILHFKSFQRWFSRPPTSGPFHGGIAPPMTNKLGWAE